MVVPPHVPRGMGRKNDGTELQQVLPQLLLMTASTFPRKTHVKCNAPRSRQPLRAIDLPESSAGAPRGIRADEKGFDIRNFIAHVSATTLASTFSARYPPFVSASAIRNHGQAGSHLLLICSFVFVSLSAARFCASRRRGDSADGKLTFELARVGKSTPANPNRIPPLQSEEVDAGTCYVARTAEQTN